MQVKWVTSVCLKNRGLPFKVDDYASCPVETSAMLNPQKLRLILRRSMDTSTIVMLAAAIVTLVDRLLEVAASRK
jgi:hypothetical protein